MDKMPDVLRIEPASICNFRCKHCIVKDKAGDIMTRETLETIINNWGFTPRVVVMYHGGEPLLNRRTPEFINIVKSLGVWKVVMNTNASLLTEKMSRRLLNSKLDELRVSFDGNTPQENDEIRIRGKFERDAANVKRFLELREGDKPVVRINNARFIPFDSKKPGTFLEPAPYLVEYFGDKVDYQSYPIRKWAGMKAEDFMTITFLDGEYPDYCSLLFETMTVKANGDIIPCCEDLLGTVVLGNINDNTLEEIWNSERHTLFREKFKSRNYPDICRSCYIVKGTYLVRESKAVQ